MKLGHLIKGFDKIFDSSKDKPTLDGRILEMIRFRQDPEVWINEEEIVARLSEYKKHRVSRWWLALKIRRRLRYLADLRCIVVFSMLHTDDGSHEHAAWHGAGWYDGPNIKRSYRWPNTEDRYANQRFFQARQRRREVAAKMKHPQ